MSMKPKTGGKKEVMEERRKSLALDRRKTAQQNDVSSKGAVKEFGYYTLTPRGLVKRSHLKEHVLNVLAVRNLRIGPFGKIEAGDDQQASWKERPNAQQSAQVLSLKKLMDQRKRHMMVYKKNSKFKNIFKEPEDRKVAPSQEATVTAGTVELVAREVIEKTAELQHREKKGVWAQLGKPYACFGLPASAIPKDYPAPIPGEMATFLDHTRKSEASALGRDHLHHTKAWKRAQAVTSESLNMQGMLVKLSLQGNTKFPREPLIAAHALKTAVKFGGCYTVERTTYSKQQQPGHDARSRRTLDLSDLFQSWRSASEGSQSVMGMDFSDAPTTNMSRGESVKSMQQSPTPSPSPIPQIEIPGTALYSDKTLHEWKMKFAAMRKRLQENIDTRIMSRGVRRKHCRSCSPFTAEVSNMLLSHLQDRGGAKTPMMTDHIWKTVEEKRERERAASAVKDPEVEAISRFYERVCAFVNNQRMDDPLMDMLIAHLKDLLELGYKLQRNLLVALCERLSQMEDHVQATGRMACLMPILNFICKELRLSSAEFNAILSKYGLDWYNNFTRNSANHPSD